MDAALLLLLPLLLSLAGARFRLGIFVHVQHSSSRGISCTHSAVLGTRLITALRENDVHGVRSLGRILDKSCPATRRPGVDLSALAMYRLSLPLS